MIPGNNDPRLNIRREELQQVQNQSNGRQRIGLMPSDGQDAYKRSSMRASKRSRADRLSYLVATGHINKEEAQELCSPLSESIIRNEQNNNHHYNLNETLPTSTMTTPIITTSSPQILPGDQAYLNYLSSFPQDKSNRNKNNQKVRLPADNRGQFRKTRTEVTLPMKTSPAFEYILKDKGRRNRRCCLWALYSSLMMIGIAILVFCSIQLALRQRHTYRI